MAIGLKQGPVHGSKAGKSALFSHGIQATRIGQEQLFSGMGPELAQIRGYGDPHILLEEAGQVLFRDMYSRGNLR